MTEHTAHSGSSTGTYRVTLQPAGGSWHLTIAISVDCGDRLLGGHRRIYDHCYRFIDQLSDCSTRLHRAARHYLLLRRRGPTNTPPPAPHLPVRAGAALASLVKAAVPAGYRRRAPRGRLATRRAAQRDASQRLLPPVLPFVPNNSAGIPIRLDG